MQAMLAIGRQAVLALSLLVALWASAQVPVPPLEARVTDLAGILTSAQRTALEERLAAFEAAKGSQLAVLIVPTTRPESVEQYGIRVAEQWKLGRKGVDDGALLLIAVSDRAVRIEVGYGLEGVVPDIIARRIIEEEIVPRFKQGDFYGGIEAGVGRMTRVIEGEPLPPPRRAVQGDADAGLQQLFIVGLLLVFVFGGLLRAVFGRFLASAMIGTVGGFIAWILVGSVLAAIILGIVMAVVSAVTGWGAVPRGGRYPGGWSSGGWGSGGGFGGGGFGGGGGGFGGGGASGRW